MILSCRISKTDLKTGAVVEKDAEFHSEIETNLEGTDENELFHEMSEKSLESMAAFQMRGSNWRF